MKRQNFSTLSRLRKNFLNRKSAVIGLAIISLLLFCAIGGYLLMPDRSPNAGDGAVELQKLPPFSSAWVIKLPKETPYIPASWLQIWWHGKEVNHRLVPLTSFPKVEGDTAICDVVGKPNQPLKIPLPPATSGTRPILDNLVEKRFFILGTDRAGRDLLSRLILGARVSLLVGIGSVALAMFIGVAVGTMSGFLGGWVDAFLKWFMLVVWSIPTILLAMVIHVMLPKEGTSSLILALGCTFWVEIARVVRSEIVRTKEKLFVDAARLMGFSSHRIVFHHIMPNILGPLLVVAASNFAAAILTEAGLSFLGLGIQPPTPSWGGMINEGFYLLGSSQNWHLMAFPSACVFLSVAGFHLMAMGLSEAFQPGKKGKLLRA